MKRQDHKFSNLCAIKQQFIKKSMIKNFFNEFDMFYADATLRAKQKPQTSSTCAGISSFILVLFFSYVFIAKSIQIFTFENIEGQQSRIRLHSEDVRSDYILFAISINLQKISDFEGVFTINGEYYDCQTDTLQVIQFQPCKPHHWQRLSQYAKDHYNENPMQKFICPKPKHNFKLKNTFTSLTYSNITIKIKSCVNNSQTTCKSQQEQRIFIDEFLKEYLYIPVWVYLFDTSINMKAHDPIEHYVNAKNRISFTYQRGIQTEILFGTYKIITDESIMPWEEVKQLEGSYVDRVFQSMFERNSVQFPFAIIQIAMNNNQIFVMREVGKIDDTLAYAGGLFALIIGFLSFFMNSFNQYRYQLMVAEGAFNYDDDGKKVREHDFQFHHYIKYSIYEWIGILFCYKTDWKDCQEIQQTRTQAIFQMDVSKLFKKLQNMETALSYIMNQDEKICLALIEPPTMKVVKHSRLISEYYNEVIKGEPAITIEDIVINKEVLKIGLQLAKKEGNQNINQKFLSSRKNILEIALHANPDIVRDAESLHLRQQLLDIEKFLANSFFKLTPQARELIQEKIPIKIIHRLRLRQDFVNSISSFQIMI